MEPSGAYVLVIDDEKPVRDIFTRRLERFGYKVAVAETGHAGIESFRQREFDIVITDIRLPDLTGEAVLQAIREIDPEAIVLMITGFATVDSSLMAMQMGAQDYFPKPVNFEHMNLVMQRVLEERRLHRQHAALEGSTGRRRSLWGLTGSSIKMNEIYHRVELLARSDMTVLVQGKTGTGKELAARAIHELSQRKGHPFVAVNCGSIPGSLLESELFGYVKGAFTGADKNKQGLFAAAHHGTILLDEIQAAPHETQGTLLRVLDRKEIRPLGGTLPIPVDVRIIAASNRILEDMVKAGEFREDLFFRIIGATFTMPSLAERPEDIPLLVEAFLQEDLPSDGKEARRFSPQSMMLLSNYSWPGNVRELKHTVQSLVADSPRPLICPSDLPPKLKRVSEDRLRIETLATVEKRHLLRVLKVCAYNKAEAARLLGVSRGTVYSLMRKHGIVLPNEA